MLARRGSPIRATQDGASVVHRVPRVRPAETHLPRAQERCVGHQGEVGRCRHRCGSVALRSRQVATQAGCGSDRLFGQPVDDLELARTAVRQRHHTEEGGVRSDDVVGQRAQTRAQLPLVPTAHQAGTFFDEQLDEQLGVTCRRCVPDRIEDRAVHGVVVGGAHMSRDRESMIGSGHGGLPTQQLAQQRMEAPGRLPGSGTAAITRDEHPVGREPGEACPSVRVD